MANTVQLPWIEDAELIRHNDQLQWIHQNDEVLVIDQPHPLLIFLLGIN